MHKYLLILPFLISGCSQPLTEVTQPEFLFGTRADPTLAIDLSKLSYPQDAQAGRDMDIIARKSDNTITFINRTTTVHQNVQIWVNQQYVGLIDEIPIGISGAFTLGRFINRYGEAFPIGGLLNPDKSFPVVLVELYNPATDNSTGQRHKLIVRVEE